MFKRGCIYLARLYPSKGHEVGKTRPVLVVQSDMLNSIGHTTVIIVPLSSKVIEDTYPLRYTITKRDNLEVDSDILCDQIRAIDINRLKEGKLASLSDEEMLHIEHQMEIILGF